MGLGAACCGTFPAKIFHHQIRNEAGLPFFDSDSNGPHEKIQSWVDLSPMLSL